MFGPAPLTIVSFGWNPSGYHIIVSKDRSSSGQNALPVTIGYPAIAAGAVVIPKRIMASILGRLESQPILTSVKVTESC